MYNLSVYERTEDFGEIMANAHIVDGIISVYLNANAVKPAI